MEEVLDRRAIACGCALERVRENGAEQVRYIPCELTCPNYLKALNTANERGEEIELPPGVELKGPPGLVLP